MYIRIDLSTDVALRIIVKNIMLKARSYGLQFLVN